MTGSPFTNSIYQTGNVSPNATVQQGHHNVIHQQIVRPHNAISESLYKFHHITTDITDYFTGREPVLAAIEQFQSTHPCGYFAVVAEAGLGKTALAAEFARRRSA